MNRFNQEEWEKKFDVLEYRLRPAFLHILKAVLAGVVLGLVLLYVGVSVGSGVSLDVPSADVGSTWITWGWSFDNASVYVDGSLVTLDNDLCYYILSGLDESSRHRIDVYDNDDLMQHYFSEDTTLLAMPTIFMIIGFVIVCICSGLIVPWFPLVGFIPATGLLSYLIENDFEGWLILFVGFLWIVCMIFSFERLSTRYRKVWRDLKRK